MIKNKSTALSFLSAYNDDSDDDEEKARARRVFKSTRHKLSDAVPTILPPLPIARKRKVEQSKILSQNQSTSINVQKKTKTDSKNDFDSTSNVSNSNSTTDNDNTFQVVLIILK
jgi:hypothetical protein